MLVAEFVWAGGRNVQEKLPYVHVEHVEQALDLRNDLTVYSHHCAGQCAYVEIYAHFQKLFIRDRYHDTCAECAYKQL